MNIVIAYLSGVGMGMLISYYWLIRPMARLLGWEKDD